MDYHAKKSRKPQVQSPTLQTLNPELLKGGFRRYASDRFFLFLAKFMTAILKTSAT